MHPREKARLYHDLGELLRSGVGFPVAIEKLGRHARGRAAAVLRGLGTALARGEPLPEAIAAQPGINALDAALFAASDRAGKLERGLALAAEYYGALAEARARMWRRAAYPLFVLHFAFVAFNVPIIFRSGMDAFGRAVLGGWLGLWLVIFAVSFVATLATRAASHNVGLDRTLSLLPLIGKLRRAFALSRFSAAYDMQLEAGVNVLAALEAAGRASASAMVLGAAVRAQDDVRNGEKVGIALGNTNSFPEEFVRSFVVGEETGRLDHELRRLSEEYRKAALQRLETIAEWMPKLLYFGVLLFVGYQIVSFYVGYMKQIQDIQKL